MAKDDRKIIIEIIEPSSPPTALNEDGTVEIKKDIGKTEKEKEKDTKVKSIRVVSMYAFNNVKDSLVDFVQNISNRSLSLTENYLAQNNKAKTMKAVKATTSLASSIIAGVKLGSIGGPIGVAIGTAVSIASWGAGQFLNYQNRMSNYYQQINESNFNTEFSQVRAGLINNSRGTEN
jgi:hypothetical protein